MCNFYDDRIILTGDAGRGALTEAAEFAENIGISLPGIDRIQVPHHGSIRNVSTEILDKWLGPRLDENAKPAKGKELFTAFICASKEDEDHPRKAVVRAFMHRGGCVITTKDGTKCTGHNAPSREGWVAVQGVDYPEDQEESS